LDRRSVVISGMSAAAYSRNKRMDASAAKVKALPFLEGLPGGG
jgi:hypothetical protein